MALLGLVAALVAVVCWPAHSKLTARPARIAIDGPTLFLQGTLLVLGLLSVLLLAERSVDAGGGAFVAQAAVVAGGTADRRMPTSTADPDRALPAGHFRAGRHDGLRSANNLLVMFVALEVLSLPLYLLCGLARRRRLLSQEAAVKYFLLGAFASAFFLYGVALLYGYAGSVDLPQILQAASGGEQRRLLLFLGLALLLVGLLFKAGVGAVPRLDPGRLPGRADAGHRVHGVLHEGRRVRRDPAGALRRASPTTRGTGGR